MRAPPLLPTGRLLRAPLWNVPFGTSQPSTPLGLRSLSPPAPGPCSSNCSWLPSRSPCQNWASVYWGQITSERVLSEMEKLALLLSHTRGTKQANCPQDCVLGLPWGSSGLESTLKCSGCGFDPWWGI